MMRFSLLLIVTIIVLSIPSEDAIDLNDSIGRNISTSSRIIAGDLPAGVDFNKQTSLLSDRLEGLLNRGRSDEAFDVINQLSKKYSSLPTIQIHLARAHVQQKNYVVAEKILLNVINISSSEGDDVGRLQAHLTLGRLYLQLKRWNDAQKCLEYVLTIDENNVIALMSISKVWLNRDSDMKKAKQFIEMAYNISPNDEKVLFEYGMMLLQNNDHLQAKQVLDKAEAINPNIDHKMLGNIYLYYQHIDWATPHFEQAFISMQASHSSSSDSSRMAVDTELITLLADCKDYMGDYSMAIDLYNLALQVEPMNALANGGLGLLLLGTGTRNYASINACGLNQEEAITHLRMALSVRPDLEMVQRALDFCKLEFTEANQWSKVVVANNRTTVTASSSSNERKKNLLTRGVVGNMLLMMSHHIFIRPMQSLCQWLKRRSYHGVFGVLCNGSTILSSSSTGSSSSSSSSSSSRVSSSAADAMKKNWKRREQSIHSSLPHLSLSSATGVEARAAANNSSELSAEQFIRDYMLSNQPAVLMNMQESWGLMTDSTRRSSLSLDVLLHNFGDNLVRVSVSEYGRFDGPEAGDKWGLSSDVDVLVRPPATTMRFRDFLHLVKSSSTRETFYLEYLALNQYLGKQFLDLIPFPKSLHSSNDGRDGVNMLEHLVTNLWIGSKPTISPLHYDDYENFLCQIAGYKELILYPPSDLENLYYIGRPKGILKYNYPGVFTRDPSSVDKNHFVFGSSVNIDHPDLQRFPRFSNAKPIRVLLKPGQVLYLPSFWHHEVQSIPGNDDDGLNIAVNFWFKNVTFPVDDMMILGMK